MDTSSLFLLTVMIFLNSKQSYETDELDEINSFVQAVLAVAERDKLGLPEVSEPVKQYTPSADGKLAPELQRYLENLLRVSSDIDKYKLVDILWDDSFVIDEDQEPSDVIDQWNGNGHKGGRKQIAETSPPWSL